MRFLATLTGSVLVCGLIASSARAAEYDTAMLVKEQDGGKQGKIVVHDTDGIGRISVKGANISGLDIKHTSIKPKRAEISVAKIFDGDPLVPLVVTVTDGLGYEAAYVFSECGAYVMREAVASTADGTYSFEQKVPSNKSAQIPTVVLADSTNLLDATADMSANGPVKLLVNGQLDKLDENGKTVVELGEGDDRWIFEIRIAAPNDPEDPSE